ncbi:MAG: ABC transporter substrate-binding protein, partial [Nitratireductor sp.]|nr:ABC transporter substrate-binding protein [Nitratireductor sp.]
KDMEGKTIAHSVGETGTSYLGVFCELNQVDCDKISKVQMDSQSRVPQFLQKQVDLVSVYKTNDLPVLEDRTGQKFPTLDMAEYGLAIPGMAVVASDDGIANKAETLKGFLAANAKAIELTRSDPDAAVAALKTVWSAGPSDKVVREQIEATSASIHGVEGHPIGWIDEKTITDALKLIGSVEDIGEMKPASSFYTNELLAQ